MRFGDVEVAPGTYVVGAADGGSIHIVSADGGVAAHLSGEAIDYDGDAVLRADGGERVLVAPLSGGDAVAAKGVVVTTRTRGLTGGVFDPGANPLITHMTAPATGGVVTVVEPGGKQRVLSPGQVCDVRWSSPPGGRVTIALKGKAKMTPVARDLPNTFGYRWIVPAVAPGVYELTVQAGDRMGTSKRFGVRAAPKLGASAPDLVIQSATATSSALRVTVRNKGNAPADLRGKILVSGGAWVAPAAGRVLAPGAMVVVDMRRTLSLGVPVSVTLTVDPSNVVAESNEWNNTFRVTLGAPAKR